MKKKTLLIDALPGTITNQFDFAGTFTDIDGTQIPVTVFTTAYFIMELQTNHFGRYAFLDPDAPSTDLLSIFNTWKATRQDLYFKQAYAYTLKYNPIENYASHEVMKDDITTHEHGEAITTSHGKTITTTDNNRTKTTTPADTTEYQREGLSSATFSPTEKEIRGGTITEVGTGSTSNAETGTTTDTHSGTDTDRHGYDLTKTGNIGVQTAADMLAREFEGVISQDLARAALYDFLDHYTFMVEVLDL